jgi:hypothetical protein
VVPIVKYSDEDDFLLFLVLSRASGKRSGNGSTLAVLLLAAFILYCLCR